MVSPVGVTCKNVAYNFTRKKQFSNKQNKTNN